MNNVYLLLRNNKQTGPFNLEELVKQDLKSTDLIWVEGRSGCWSYPSEINALKPYLAGSNVANVATDSLSPATSQQMLHEQYMPLKKETPQTPQSPVSKNVISKNIYVSLPFNAVQQATTPTVQQPIISKDITPDESLERKAEEIRRRALAFTSEQKPPHTESIVETKYSRPLSDIKEEYTSWMYKEKSKQKKSVSDKTLAILITVTLIVSVWYIAAKYIYPSKNPPSQEIAIQDNTATQVDPVSANQETTPEQEIITNVSTQTNLVPEKKPASYITPVKITKKSPKTNTSNSAIKSAIKITVPAKEIKNEKQQVARKEETVVNSVPAATRETKETAVAPSQKKKTFGEKLDGFFSRLKGKKVEEKPVEEPQTTSAGPVLNERKARRRDDEISPVTQTENLKDLIDITSSEPSDKWMLGVHGLKLTVHNRSNSVVKNAAVEVLYYNEQKELLEKKMVIFNSLSPEKSLTVSVPDHRLADHIGYRLVSANN